MGIILVIAGKEFRDGLRNRWVVAISVILAVFALGIAYVGSAAAGTVGFTSLDTTIVSLSSLAIFVIPLIALLLAYDTVVGEDAQGTLLLLLSYPITRVQIITGKLLGHGLVLATSTAVGFGVAGALIAVASGNFVDPNLWAAFAYFIVTAILLGWVFIAIAILISVLSAEKARAAGAAFVVWFLFVLVFDLGLLGLLVATEGSVGANVFPYLLLLNPTDVFRLANLTGFEAAQAYSGLASVAARGVLAPGSLLMVMVAWAVVPFVLAAWLFRHRGT